MKWIITVFLVLPINVNHIYIYTSIYISMICIGFGIDFSLFIQWIDCCESSQVLVPATLCEVIVSCSCCMDHITGY